MHAGGQHTRSMAHLQDEEAGRSTHMDERHSCMHAGALQEMSQQGRPKQLGRMSDAACRSNLGAFSVVSC